MDLATRARLLIGAKRRITVDDSFALPAVKAAVEKLGYGKLGKKIGAGGEYSVRELGKNKVARIDEPDNIKHVKNYIKWSENNLAFLRENIPDCIPNPEIVLAELDDDTGCCVVIEDKVRGKGLSQLQEDDLAIIKSPLLSILRANEKFLRERGLVLDLTAIEHLKPTKNPSIVFNPRHTDNIFATIDEDGKLNGGALLLDLLALPNKYNPNFPKRFRMSSLWYRLVGPAMLKYQRKLINKLESIQD